MNAASWTVCLPKTRSDFADDEFRRNATPTACLRTTPVSMLTLISCYPFNFIGNAPKRFIVRAERMPTRPQMSAKGWAR